MIAADTSVMIAYLQGDAALDMALLDEYGRDGAVCLPPVVVTELLSGTRPMAGLEKLLSALPVLKNDDHFWHRAGNTRRLLLSRGIKAKLGDVLIAQACMDHDVELLTRDADFAAFSAQLPLKLVRVES